MNKQNINYVKLGHLVIFSDGYIININKELKEMKKERKLLEATNEQ